MKWALLVIYYSAFGGAAIGQAVIVQTETRQQCEAARAELLKVPGYNPKYLLCIEGEMPDWLERRR